MPPPAPAPPPGPLPAGEPRGLSRRSALGLVVGAAVATAGCRPMTVAPPPTGRPSLSAAPQLDPDVSLAAVALGQEQQMLDLVRDTAARHRSLERRLADAEQVHAAHVALLTKAVPRDVRPRVTAAASPSAAPSSAPSSAPSASASPSPPGSLSAGPASVPASSSPAPTATSTPGLGAPVRIPVPARSDRALVAVYEQEDLLSLDQKRNAFAADSGAFARVLASMAAAAAQQGASLRGVPSRGAP